MRICCVSANGDICGRSYKVSTVLSDRLKSVASATAITVVTLSMTSAVALAECLRPQNPPVNVLDFIPLATGTVTSSVISTISTINSSSLAQSSGFVGSPQNPGPDQQGGGRWSRVIAGSTDAENNTTTSGVLDPGGANIALGSNDCRSVTQHDFVGTQAGMDIGRFNFAGGGNLSYGVTAGYFDIKSKDKTPNVGTFDGDSQVPFAGLYMAINSGNFAFDAQVRGDYFTMNVNDVDQGMFNQPLTARGVAFLWNASYRFSLANNWFIEPSIGGVSSRTEVDQFDVAGGRLVDASISPSFSRPGTIKIDDISSLQGRASVRVGTTIIAGQIAWQPFATASVFHEFAGDVRTNMSTLDAGFPLSGESTTSREGTVGHVGLGLAGVVLDSGWLGYVRGDYRFGENIESVSVNAGLRYQFQPAAMPAGLKDDAGGAAPVANYNWTGLYAGWSTGALWGDQDFQYNVGNEAHPKHQGYLIGGQAGYNIQFGHTVLGVEADYNWSNADGGGRTGFNPFFSVGGGINSIGFLTGRIGYAHQRALYYVKGGLAFGEVEGFAKDNLDGTRVLADPVLSSKEWQTGWAFGAGMEYAVSDRWTVRGEWMHYDLGNAIFPLQGTTEANVDTSGHLARVGINYQFGHRTVHSEPLK